VAAVSDRERPRSQHREKPAARFSAAHLILRGCQRAAFK
jgi:hypothetical protein